MHQQSAANPLIGFQVVRKGALRAADAICAAFVDTMLAKAHMEVLRDGDLSHKGIALPEPTHNPQ